MKKEAPENRCVDCGRRMSRMDINICDECLTAALSDIDPEIPETEH